MAPLRQNSTSDTQGWPLSPASSLQTALNRAEFQSHCGGFDDRIFGRAPPDSSSPAGHSRTLEEGGGEESPQSFIQASLSTLGHDENIFLRGNLTLSNYVNSMDYSIHFVSLTIAILPTIIQ